MAKTPSLQELHLLSPIEWVKEERRRQDKKWGKVDHGSFRMFTILSEEVGEVARVLEQGCDSKLSQEEYEQELEYELIQVAAVAVKWLEAIRRRKGSHLKPAEKG